MHNPPAIDAMTFYLHVLDMNSPTQNQRALCKPRLSEQITIIKHPQNTYSLVQRAFLLEKMLSEPENCNLNGTPVGIAGGNQICELQPLQVGP